MKAQKCKVCGTPLTLVIEKRLTPMVEGDFHEEWQSINVRCTKCFSLVSDELMVRILNDWAFVQEG